MKVALLSLGLILSAADAVSADTISCGETHVLHSNVLGEDRTVFVSAPTSRGSSDETYPVIYLTDGQWQFDEVRSTTTFLARNGLMPQVIVVAIANVDRTSDLYATHADFKQGGRTIAFPTSGHADRFLEFLEKELIPWADSSYRTAPLRILAGHSAGGNFALHVMRVRPELFQVIIAASPWMEWDDGKELKALLPFLSSAACRTKALFFTCADEGPEMNANLDAMTSTLRARRDQRLRWDSIRYPRETHDSVVIKSYFDALRMVFAGWPAPRDPETNALTGPLEEVESHYAKLGESLGYAVVAPEGTINEFGYECLQAKRVDSALRAFRYNTDHHPRSANAWDSLGDGLAGSGKKAEALECYRKAVALAEADGSPLLGSYRKHVEQLAGATGAK